MSLTLDEIMEVIDKAYPDGLIMEYYKNPKGICRDGLAQFIVQEMTDLYTPDADPGTQLAECMRGIDMAMSDLTEVRTVLEDASEAAALKAKVVKNK